jgi:hypothetical protein
LGGTKAESDCSINDELAERHDLLKFTLALIEMILNFLASFCQPFSAAREASPLEKEVGF